METAKNDFQNNTEDWICSRCFCEISFEDFTCNCEIIIDGDKKTLIFENGEKVVLPKILD